MDNDNENETTEEIAEDFIEKETTPEETIKPSETEPDPEKEELKKKLATAEAQKDHWKKKASKPKAEEKTDDISSKDLYALMNSKVPEEDVDEVVRIAKALNQTIPEALKSNVVKTILSDNKEKRTTADVTNTDNTRMGPTQLSDDALLANAQKGELPEDDESIERLIEAKNQKK